MVGAGKSAHTFYRRKTIDKRKQKTPSMPAATTTRASARAALRTAVLTLPDDLWIEILARLPPADLPAALAASPREFGRLAPWAWRALCFARWPASAATSAAAGVPIADWKRQAEFYALRDREEAVAATVGRPAGPLAGAQRASAGSPPAVPQPVVGPRHRAILVEWLAEVRESLEEGVWGPGGARMGVHAAPPFLSSALFFSRSLINS
jgi:hypothetical protein